MGRKLNFIVLSLLVLAALLMGTEYQFIENTGKIDTGIPPDDCGKRLCSSNDPRTGFFMEGWCQKEHYFYNAAKFCGFGSDKCIMGGCWF